MPAALWAFVIYKTTTTTAMNKPKQSRDPNKMASFIFGSEDDNSSNKEIPIDQITTRKNQPRKYFDENKLQDLAASIKQQGILQPLIIRPTENKKYELIAGERRLKAAKLAGLTTVPATIKELTDKDAISISLIENLQREDLNPIEETEGILLLLSHETAEDPEELAKLLMRMELEDRKKVSHNVMGSELAEQIIDIFRNEALAMTWQSFVKNRLPLRNLPEEIASAIKQGQIAYTKGQEINKLKNPEERRELLEKAIQEKLSLTEIKKEIKELREQHQPTDKDTLPKRITAIAKKAKKVSDDKKDAIEQLLKQIEELLQNE